MKLRYELTDSKLKLDDVIKYSKYDNDAGIDIKLTEDIMIEPWTTKVVGTKLKVFLPYGFMGILITRSSVSMENITIGNAPIDASYTGEIHLMVSNNSNTVYKANKGDRLAQLVIMPIMNIELVNNLVQREENGLGSSGN